MQRVGTQKLDPLIKNGLTFGALRLKEGDAKAMSY